MTWATIGRMLIIHCFEEKKASLLKTVSLCQNVQFCFVFHEARNANLNLYKRLLKNIQIISKKLRLAVIDSPWLLESPFSRELGTSEWSCKGEGFGCPAEPSVCWRPAWARSCKGPLLIYQGRGSRPLFFSFLTFSWGVLQFWEQVQWFPLASLPGVKLTGENERWLQGMLETTSISASTSLEELGQHSVVSPLAPLVKTQIFFLMSHDGLY